MERRSLLAVKPLARQALVLCLFVAAAVPLLSSCGLTPTTGPSSSTPQTFQQLYATAVTADDVIVQAATAALTSGAITAAQAKIALSATDSIKAVLDAAYALSQAGNVSGATTNLASAVGTIAVLSTCFTQKPLTAASYAACTANLSIPKVL